MQLEKAKEQFQKQVRKVQDDITSEIQKIDPKVELIEDLWDRLDFAGAPGGGGRTRVLRNGEVFENCGVHFSQIHGRVDPQFARTLPGGADIIWATGVSVILHPFNPKVPTVHCNFRMIHSGEAVWFGGGADLTPYYPHVEDFQSFHHRWMNACAAYDCYPLMKKNCDEYFVNHHRNGEMRGVGGIFYDHFSSGDLERDLQMSVNLSEAFCSSYFPLAHRRYQESYTPEDVEFQLYRRGRYVEFNLLHDRGTHFGLKTKGRTESILSSLPARAKFGYDYAPLKGSVHEKMMDYYFPRSWN